MTISWVVHHVGDAFIVSTRCNVITSYNVATKEHHNDVVTSTFIYNKIVVVKQPLHEPARPSGAGRARCDAPQIFFINIFYFFIILHQYNFIINFSLPLSSKICKKLKKDGQKSTKSTKMTPFLTSYISQLIGSPAISMKMQKIAIFENPQKSLKIPKIS